MSVLFHDAFLDHVLEIFWSEKCAVLLNCLFLFNCLVTFGISNASLRGNLDFIYSNCFYDLIGSFKLDLYLLYNAVIIFCFWIGKRTRFWMDSLTVAIFSHFQISKKLQSKNCSQNIATFKLFPAIPTFTFTFITHGCHSYLKVSCPCHYKIPV